ncbi:uncharacterized protein [Chelonus insularis]|uniref:uncharacterized protein n=1 Tax=Chelonus insularis TaxID=460826 RepID=UPI001588BCF0|nr:uncharacterized protein LOC118065115 [Chelonus insularis]
MKKSTDTQEKSRQSLSAVKKGPVKGLKNVLASPQEFVWPILRTEKKIKELEAILRELLPQKRNDSKLSWAQLRGLSKDERKILRKRNSHAQTNPEKDKIFNCIIFGINAVTKALEKETVCSILLDSSVDPLFIFKHIIIMAQNKDIPVIIIPALKTLTLEKRGFASAALAIKKIAIESENSSLFLKLSTKISQLIEEFPKALGNLQIFDDKNSETVSLMEEDNSDIVNVDVTEVKPFILEPSIYKYRISCKERVFLPSNSTQSSDNISSTIEEKTSEEYISFNSENIINKDNVDVKVLARKRYIDELQDEEEREHEVEQSIDSTEEFTNNNMDNTTDIIKNKGLKSRNVNLKKSRKRKIPHNTYMPLKVKQIRKNPNRVKGKKKIL